MSFKRKEELCAKLKTSLWVDFVLAIMLTAQQLSVSSAPLTAFANNNQSFFDSLYLNSSDPSCTFLPQLSQQDRVYVRLEVNQLCGSNNVTQVSINSAKINASRINLCNSLAEIFKMLCKSTNNLQNLKMNTTVDLRNVSSLGIKNVCGKIKGFVSHTGGSSAILSESAISNSNDVGEEDQASCENICKNNRIIREGFSEYSDLAVQPTCILLFEGYTRYQQKLSLTTQSQSAISEKPSSVSKTVIVSSTSPTKDKNPTIVIPTTILESKTDSVDSAIQPVVRSDVTEQSNKIPVNENGVSSSPTVSKQPELPVEHGAANPIDNGTPIPADKNAAKMDEPVTSSFGTSESKLESNKIPTEEPKDVVKQKLSSSTSTTVASVDIKGNDEPLPIENSSKTKSSTAIPKENEGSIISKPNTAKDDNIEGETNAANGNGNNVASENGQQSLQPTQSKNKNDNTDVLADLDDDGIDYNGDPDNEMVKPPARVTEDKDSEIPQPDTHDVRYEPDTSFKSPNSRFSDNTFREDIDFSHGTTINVSLKESEDTGFFSYFLFCVTLVGIVYLVIHNKKKLIAYVVEGRRPRSRSRRTSGSGSQYKRLENNFD